MMSACDIEAIINAEREMSAKLNNWWTQTLNSEILYGKTPEVEVDKEVEVKANALVKAEAAAKLLPYPSGIINDKGVYITTCPKCGTETYLPKFRADSAITPECLRWCCPCGYAWFTKTKDAQ